MLTEQTVERLRHLRLGAIADACLAQQREPATAALSFDERLGMLVDAEQLARDHRALTRRLKEAKLRLPHACLEDLSGQGAAQDQECEQKRGCATTTVPRRWCDDMDTSALGLEPETLTKQAGTKS